MGRESRWQTHRRKIIDECFISSQFFSLFTCKTVDPLFSVCPESCWSGWWRLLSWSHASITSSSSESSTSWSHGDNLFRFAGRCSVTAGRWQTWTESGSPSTALVVFGGSSYICMQEKLSGPVFWLYNSPRCLRRCGDGAREGHHPTAPHTHTDTLSENESIIKLHQ